MFNIIKRPVELHFYTNDPLVYEYFQIDRGVKWFPDWIKNIDPALNEPNFSQYKKTIKKCPGVLELYKNSFILPLWTELGINIKNKSVHISVSDNSTRIDSHADFQRGTFLPQAENIHLKIVSPWRTETKSSVQFLISACSFSSETLISQFHIPNAIRSYNISAGNNIHAFISNHDQDISIEAGTPLVHIFPLTDKKVNLQCHFDPEKFHYLEALQPNRFSFSGSYFAKKKLINL